MKILSYILRLIGGLGIAYGIGMIMIWVFMWGGYKVEAGAVAVISISLLGGIIINRIGNRLYKGDGTKAASFKLTR